MPSAPAIASGSGAGTGAPSSPPAGAAAGEGVRVVEKRVLRVHTGGEFTSGVSLPVPHKGNLRPELSGAASTGAKGLRNSESVA